MATDKDTDDLDLELDDEIDDLEDDDEEETEDEQVEEQPVPDKNDKRVRDLQSAKDKETARANKAEAELRRLKTGNGKTAPEGEPLPREYEQWVAEAKTQARTQLYESDPRLKEYGLRPELITGSTPAEMRASFTALKKMVNGIESKARSKAAEEFGGVLPDLGGSDVATGKVDWANLSSEEFNKRLDSMF